MSRSRRTLEVLSMAGIALGREALELADGSAFVAGAAIQGGVRAEQRKPILVLLNLLN